MASMGRRLAAAAAVLGSALVIAPGVASAYSATLTGARECLDDGSWTATATVTNLVGASDGDGSLSGTISISGTGAVSWGPLDEGESETFSAGTLADSVASVTFTVSARWTDGFQYTPPPLTFTRPRTAR